jgi:hypothetical protein
MICTSSYIVKCDDCGRFLSQLKSRFSSAIIYDLIQLEPMYEHIRCQACTEKLGPIHSNACPADGDMSQYETINLCDSLS